MMFFALPRPPEKQLELLTLYIDILQRTFEFSDFKDLELFADIMKNVDKALVLQDTRSFHSCAIVPRKCCSILTKLLLMLNQGEKLSTTEATDAFFAITKLFQCPDSTLRCLIYLCIKELAPIANDVIIVTSSLIKDMTGREDVFRGPAIRALWKISDPSMLQSVERYMKQAIVDKSSSVASAALVSAYHLAKFCPDIIKRWSNEIQEAINYENISTQYHALGVLCYIKQSDRLAVRKIVNKFVKSSLCSQFAYVFLIRVAAELLEENNEKKYRGPLYTFLQNSLRHKSETVVYEAACTLVSLKGISDAEIAPAISVLQLFMNSQKSICRFAAVKVLNKIADTHPLSVSTCNLDLESLINSTNRSVATLAITTLLKTGSESNIDRLMKQISGFISEIDDEFKSIVIDAIRSLCSKFPKKHNVFMKFLSVMSREEGGVEYKESIIDTIISIIKTNPDALETGFGHLCEFIEDCEHVVLVTKILHFLGSAGAWQKFAVKYMRYIYNRIILELPAVRAAAITSLAKLGAGDKDLLKNVLTVLKRSMMDPDDEVRDRACIFYKILQCENVDLNFDFVLTEMDIDLSVIDEIITLRQNDPEFRLDINDAAYLKKKDFAPSETVLAVDPDLQRNISEENILYVKGFGQLGIPFKSSAPVDLTETDVEYYVRCTKHMFTDHILFQFDIENTLNDVLLENVIVALESDVFDLISYTPCASIAYNETGSTYALLELSSKDRYDATFSFSCVMKFNVRDVDPITGEAQGNAYADEFSIEGIDVNIADLLKTHSNLDWDERWELLPFVEKETFVLPQKSIKDALQNVIDFFDVKPFADTDFMPEDTETTHTLLLAAKYRGDFDILIKSQLVYSSQNVHMQLTVKSDSAAAAQAVISAVDY